MNLRAEVDDALHNVLVKRVVRVPTKVAKQILLENANVFINNTKRWLRFENMGLGVYEMTIADINCAPKNLIIKSK